MKAHLEPTHYILRTGSKFEKYGDPYEFACTVIRIGDTGFIFGAAGALSAEIRQAVREELKAHGITHVEWSRIQTGGEKKVEREV